MLKAALPVQWDACPLPALEVAHGCTRTLHVLDPLVLHQVLPLRCAKLLADVFRVLTVQELVSSPLVHEAFELFVVHQLVQIYDAFQLGGCDVGELGWLFFAVYSLLLLAHQLFHQFVVILLDLCR